MVLMALGVGCLLLATLLGWLLIVELRSWPEPGESDIAC
jgi:hypothetical protein